MTTKDTRSTRERIAARRTAYKQSRAAPAAEPAKDAQPAKTAKVAQVAPSRPVPPIKKPEPAKVTVIEGGKPKRLKISDTVLARAKMMRHQGQHFVPATEVFAPSNPPPGVLPEGTKVAMDSALTAATTWAGTAGNQWMVQFGYAGGLTFPGYPLLAELAQRTEYRKPSERLATEMTRKWIKLTSTGDEDKTEKLKDLNTFLEDIELRKACERLPFYDGIMGRAHLYLDTGDTDSASELLTPIGNGRNTISKSKVGPSKPLQRIQVVDPTWVYPSKYNSINPLKPDWLRPSTWYAMGQEIHTSRLLPFIGREVPDLMKAAFNFGGLSLTQMLMPYVDNWTSTRQHINRLIGNFSKNGIKTDMQQMLAPNPDGGGDSGGDNLMSRIQLYTDLQDNGGLMVLDTSTKEEFFQHNTPLGTLDALQSQSLEQMCLPTGMPVIILLGLTPQGLNASSEGEMRAWEAWVEAYQKHFYGDAIQRVIDFAQLSLWGQVDESIGFEWVPLRTLDEKEQAETRTKDAERDMKYVDGGVLHPIEVRQKLASDPLSGYSNIDADDVPEAPEPEGGAFGPEDGGEPAPGAPEAGSGEPAEPKEGGDSAGRPFARDEAKWDESKHPRAENGQFGSGGGGKAGNPPAKSKTTGKSTEPAGTGGKSAPTPTFKSKKDLVGHLLTEGTTAKEILAATGWPTVSVPAQAAAAGLRLEKFKDGGETRYRGIPMTDAELAERDAARAARAAAKRGNKAPAARGWRSRDASTFTLTEFISAMGGIKPTPDVKAIFSGENPFIPGFGRLLRKDGMTPDRARETAVEGGYLHDPGRESGGLSESTITQLLEALDADSRGKKQYRLGQGNRAQIEAESRVDAEEQRHRMEGALDDALEGVGMKSTDLAPAMRDRTIEIMEREGIHDPIEAYEKAMMEQDQRDIDAGDEPDRVDEIPGWDGPDDDFR